MDEPPSADLVAPLKTEFSEDRDDWANAENGSPR
jgi:hypothetical protein